MEKPVARQDIFQRDETVKKFKQFSLPCRLKFKNPTERVFIRSVQITANSGCIR